MTRTGTPAAAVFFLICAHSAAAVASQLFVDPMFGVSVTSDIEYGTNVDGNNNNVSLTLDLYEPTGVGVPAQRPAIVIMHGGTFVTGSKTNATMVAYANAFASRGYVAVSINYRKLDLLPPAPGASLPYYSITPERRPTWVDQFLIDQGVTEQQYLDTVAAAIGDEATAINWLAANAATYNINPNWLAAGGYSAGAVSSLALAAGGVVDGVSNAPLGAIFSLAGALFGYESAFDSNSPGVFLIHGEDDVTVPFTETPYLEAALTNAGVPYDTLYVPNADHTSQLLFDAITAEQDRIFQFMADQLGLPVPEPSSLVLAVFGLVGVTTFAWRRRARRAAH